MGVNLWLPPWLEQDRKRLEKILPKVNIPSSPKTAKITEEKGINVLAPYDLTSCYTIVIF